MEAVAAHETLHLRKDGITWVNWLSASYDEGDHRSVPGDGRLYGNWIIHHHKSKCFEAYVGTARLKVVDGEVFMALGFAQWLRMATVRWKDEIRCYPVGDDGLPVGFRG